MQSNEKKESVHTPLYYGQRTGTKSRALLNLEKSLTNSIIHEEERCARLREEKKELEDRVNRIDEELSRMQTELNEKMDVFLRLYTSN